METVFDGGSVLAEGVAAAPDGTIYFGVNMLESRAGSAGFAKLETCIPNRGRKGKAPNVDNLAASVNSASPRNPQRSDPV